MKKILFLSILFILFMQSCDCKQRVKRVSALYVENEVITEQEISINYFVVNDISGEDLEGRKFLNHTVLCHTKNNPLNKKHHYIIYYNDDILSKIYNLQKDRVEYYPEYLIAKYHFYQQKLLYIEYYSNGKIINSKTEQVFKNNDNPINSIFDVTLDSLKEVCPIDWYKFKETYK